MSNTIIQVENLGKKYLIKHQQQGNYTALRDVITDKVKSLGKKIISPWNHKQSSTYSTTEEFWALKDISFKVKQGEVIGIIGRNGAGKSTLLKILSRITEPTTGRIRINGRVASLLEVGTGFHPELTGRENIFLNGAILGMGKAEIKRKFDEIVAFAEVEKFLDTPVKRYSSGMYVRLAFAVAAHLEPEILIVDEVLAVGDAQFQKKCLGKMEDVAVHGRTVLFVSHNMDAILRLCQKGIFLAEGRNMDMEKIENIVEIYMTSGVKTVWNSEQVIFGKNTAIRFFVNGEKSVEQGEPVEFEIEVKESNIQGKCDVAIGIMDTYGRRVTTFATKYQLGWPLDFRAGNRVRVNWENNYLLPGDYFVTISIYFGTVQIDSYSSIGPFRVEGKDIYGTGFLPDSSYQGSMYPLAKWSFS